MASLAEALARRGHQITIFSHLRDPRVLPRARWHRVPMLPWPHVARFASFLVANTLWRFVCRVLRGEQFDAVLSTGPDVLAPTVTAFHCCATSIADSLESERNGYHPQGDGFRRWTNLLTYRMVARLEGYVVCRGAGSVVAVSNGLKGDIARAYGAPEARLRVVYDGVQLTDFRPASCDERRRSRLELSLPQDQPVVLFVGHNWERKGLRVLADAVSRLQAEKPELRPFLLVVGGARASAREAQLEEVLRGQVRFIGKRDDLERIYAASDICVLPSNLESFGLPVLEAMACGLAVIVSRSAGVAELIRDGVDGMLLDDPRNVDELASKLARLLADPRLRQSLGASARATAEQYSWDNIAEQFEAVLKDSVARSE